jgi:putative PIN family toxin of toxin-antitoxin system
MAGWIVSEALTPPVLGIMYNTNMRSPRVVLDTNVLVAAARSRQEASFRLLSLVGTGRFEIAVSVPLAIEYEDVLFRDLLATHLTETAVNGILDYICSVAQRQEVFFLWRPFLSDPKDDLLLEVAVAGHCEAIVTHNLRDFAGIERFGLRAVPPRDFLKEIGETS